MPNSVPVLQRLHTHSNLADITQQPQQRDLIAYLNDDQVASWLVFSDAWNAIVDELRSIDLVCNAERDNLQFVHLDIDATIKVSSGCAWA